MRKILYTSILLIAAALLLFADTTTETWTDTADWATFTCSDTTDNCDVTSSCAENTTADCDTGDSCWETYCEGRSDEKLGHTEWTGAWTDFGVTAGHTVSTVQMTDVRTRFDSYSTCNVATAGPYELRNSSDTLVSTLWTGRTASGSEGSYTSEGSQSAQGCGSICAAASSIELWFGYDLQTGNDMNANCGYLLDELDISIEHAVVAAADRHRIMVTRTRLGVRNGKMVVLSTDTQPADSD